MVSVSLAVLIQSWSKIACGQGVFNAGKLASWWNQSRISIMAAIDPVDLYC
jgi:hypothetical protein